MRQRISVLAVGVLAAGLITAVSLPADAAVAPVNGGTYTLVSGSSGKCLNVSGSVLVQLACAPGATQQQFKVTAQGGGFALSAVSRCAEAAAQIAANACTGGTSQTWTFTASTAVSGKYLVRNASSALCMTNRDASTAGNNPIVQQTCTDASQTQWAFNLVSAPGPGPAAAFPGAAGPAMYATGGRGGDVYHVTNLTDNATGPQAGSLRYGITTAPATGRTIVFDVGGTIKLSPGGRQGWLTIGARNLTIAGQTAPRPGITIMGQATKVTGSNIVIRHLKFRPGQDQANPGTATNDGIWITGDNVIVDHVSVSWYDDEGISSSDGAGQVSVQYAIVSEGLNYKGHGYGALVGSDVTGSNIAYHHNLFAHNVSRLPRLGNETGAVNNVEWSNNVVFEGKGYSGENQLANANFVGNTYLRHNSSNAEVFTGATGTSAYLSGNRADYDGDSNLANGQDIAWDRFVSVPAHRSTRFAVPNMTTESAPAALTRVLDRAGAFWWARDAVDARIVSETRSTTGTLISYPNSSQWNALWNAGQVSGPSGWDTDRDGMPNSWETANGFNPNAADHNGDADGDGYRNIEEYLDAAAQGA
ncbi:RICIN domain-containing protein [Actinoplanes sp. NPDC051861]|uniref:RICIN domain-containing protein n=1 Tax=Actinoplanes sp. NPDC051861 TaxID=3155170 RepID=UPI00342B1C60